MKRFNPFYILAFVSGYFVAGMAFMLSIPVTHSAPSRGERKVILYRPGEIMARVAWPFHRRDLCVKRSDGYVYDRKLYFGNREACESYQKDQRHPPPPSSHHWTPGNGYNLPPGVEVEDGTRYLDLFKYQPQKPAIAVCDATNLSACIITFCTKAGETGCADVVCMGRNLVDGCPNYEPPPLDEDRALTALSIAVGAQICKDRPTASVWIRDKTKWLVVPCPDLQFAITAVGGIGSLI